MKRHNRCILALACWIQLALAHAVAAPVAPVSVPRFTHPGAGQVYYFVLTDRFANGSTANDAGGIAGGPEASGFDPTRIGFFHGGDFVGLTTKLDYIKRLGVTTIWVTPPFRNKPVQSGSAGYHGYWILDFLHVDPHLGTDEEFREFVTQAHARGLKVCVDIVINHTADVIRYQGGHYDYIDRAAAPYRDADGRPFDERAVAYNGLNDPGVFPALSAARSFAYVPVVPPDEAQAKNPAWLNDPIHYHNRGNSTFRGESATHGDFGGLDDVFTEQPAVVRGFIDIYRHWVEEYGVDDFRIDTVKHVNIEFWQAFAPAIREAARRAGKPGFIQFGEVADETGDVPLLSEFSTAGRLDATLDFGFFRAARRYVSQLHSGAELAEFFALDDYYTDHDRNAQAATTFLDNHDAGRFAYFLQQDNPDATREQLASLVQLGHGLLLLARGQPVLYYGDEQGMIGRGGNDMQAREDMFAAQSPDFKSAALLGTTRTGADDKFDEQHPLYRAFHDLIALRTAHPALSRGAMLMRPTGEAALFAFSRIERSELVEYLAVFNNSRTATLTARVPTSQPAGAALKLLYASRMPPRASAQMLQADDRGCVAVTLQPLEFSVWQATAWLPAPAAELRVKLTIPEAHSMLSIPTRELDGQTLPVRQEIRAEVTGGDGVAEVTFTMTRGSRPGQSELLGVDDAPPYRIFWRPPPDLAPGEALAFNATVDNLRGSRAASRIEGLTLAPGTPVFGIKGSTVPVLKAQPPATVTVAGRAPLTLGARADGSGPLHYQWLRDGVEIPGATEPVLSFPRASAALCGHYRVLVRGLSGTVVGGETSVAVGAETAGRIEHLPPRATHFVASRRVDVWLPPGYDSGKNEAYPVLYMHDGQNLFDPVTSFGGIAWEVDQAMCRLIAAGKTSGAIIVGVWNTPARTAEFLPQKAVTTLSLAQIGGLVSRPDSPIQSDAYLKFLVTELKPLIDRTYRTQADRAHTFVMGSSMGGLISAYALAEYPDVFGGAGCVSTHWPAGDGAVIDYLAAHLPPPGTHRLYFDYGTETLDTGYAPYQRRMDDVMRRAGYTEGRDWITEKFPGAEHSEKSWRERVEVPLRFLLCPGQ